MLLILAVLLVLVAAAPTIVAVTPLRNLIVELIVDNPHLKITLGRASFGWFTPLAIDDLQIVRSDGGVRVDIERVATDQSWLGLVRSRPNIGTIQFDSPSFDVTLLENPLVMPEQDGEAPRLLFTALVRDASFQLRLENEPRPAIDLADLNFEIRIEPSPAGRVLVVSPAVIFESQPLTPALCQEGLQLVAPVLANAAWVDGEVSFEFSQLRVPLDGGDPSRNQEFMFEGRLQLHDVSTEMKNPILEQVMGVLGGIVQVDVTDKIQIANESDIRISASGGRVYHEGLEFGLPGVSDELVIRTSGWVGLDESLDLQLEVPIPIHLRREGPLARFIDQLADQPLRLHVGGTLDDPDIQLADGWLAGLTGGEQPANGESSEHPLLQSLGNVVQPADPDDRTTAVIDLIRAGVRRARERRQNEPEPPDRQPRRRDD